MGSRRGCRNSVNENPSSSRAAYFSGFHGVAQALSILLMVSAPHTWRRSAPWPRRCASPRRDCRGQSSIHCRDRAMTVGARAPLTVLEGPVYATAVGYQLFKFSEGPPSGPPARNLQADDRQECSRPPVSDDELPGFARFPPRQLLKLDQFRRPALLEKLPANQTVSKSGPPTSSCRRSTEAADFAARPVGKPQMPAQH